MAQEKTGTSTPDLRKLAQASKAQADAAQSRSGGKVVQGPFEVGKLGQVAVIEREFGSGGEKYLYAEFTGTGRPSRIPLAAVATLAEQMG